MTHGFEHAAHLAIAPFGNGDPVPAIGTFASTVFNGTKRRHAIVQAHAIEQLLLFLIAQGAKHTHRVFALKTETRVHQLVGKLSRAGEQQQAFGIQIQAPNRLPLALHEPGQLAKDGGPVLGIVMGHHLPHWLVVRNHTCWRRVDAVADGFAVDLDLIAELDALADVGWLVVDGDAPFQNELLHLEARAQTRLRQHLVELGCFDLGQQHTLGRRSFCRSVIRVKTP